MIGSRLLNNMIQLISVKVNQFWKVMELTEKGRKEITSPTLYKRKIGFSFKETETIITKQDRQAFDALDSFLGKFNDQQKNQSYVKI